MSLKLARTAAVLAAVAIACVYVYAFVVHRPSPARDGPDVSQGLIRPDLVFKGVQVEGREAGERIWTLSAARVEAGARGSQTRLDEITEGELYRTGEAHYAFSAGRGVLDSSTGMLSLMGGVKVGSGGRDLLEADEVRWDPARSMVIVPGPARLHTANGEAAASSLEIDVRSSEILTQGEVHVDEGNSGPGSGVTIKSAKMRINPDTGSVEAEGATEITFRVSSDE
ncbi:MAG: LPS export ABC transporter periplasmic protein LptC [Clostridia bacterium]|nr:LPS export ABC transporter periplasmic protein LptC [Clostridia bacterium]